MTLLFQKMATFSAACEEFMEQRRNKRMVNGIALYKSVQEKKPGKELNYLAVLRYSETLKGPVNISFTDSRSFSVGRASTCNLVLPEDIFLEETNRKHDKEKFHT